MRDGFRGKVAVVTGASHGISEHIALGLATAGARLVLAARRSEELARVADACRKAAERGGRGGEGGTVVVLTDLTDPAQGERLISRAITAFGRTDVLVNNAGLGMWTRVDGSATCRCSSASCA